MAEELKSAIENAEKQEEKRPLTAEVTEYMDYLQDVEDGKEVEEPEKEEKEEDGFTYTERHSIKPFRGDGKLGVIRLDNLSQTGNKNVRITIAGKEFIPVGFDTYGHPVISEENFEYYKAMKFLAERKGESLVPTIEYNKRWFCIRKDVYDSIQGIQKTTRSLQDFKRMLISRKHAAFSGEELHEFIVFERFILANDGRVYEVSNVVLKDIDSKEAAARSVYSVDEVEYYESCGHEVHVPDPHDVCAVCGKGFDMSDISTGLVSETKDARKVHSKCLSEYEEALEFKRACEIIDAVFEGRPVSEVVYDEDEEDGKVTWYLFKTNQGTIGIRFKTKVIDIKWFDNYKPFNMHIFDDERVTKYDRGIHAWSKDDAIKYLVTAKKA